MTLNAVMATSNIYPGAMSQARTAQPVASVSVAASGWARNVSMVRTMNREVSTNPRPSVPPSSVAPMRPPASAPVAQEACRPNWVHRMRPLVSVSGSLPAVRAEEGRWRWGHRRRASR